MPLPAQNIAYVETTILADSLLKTGTLSKREADQALKVFKRLEVPTYAVKEFKSGVLVYYAWLHNCFVSEKTLSGSLVRIHRVMARMKGRASDCRNLGDAVFAFFAPNTSAILTTNIRDHRPLAAAVGKTAISPKEVLAP